MKTVTLIKNSFYKSLSFILIAATLIVSSFASSYVSAFELNVSTNANRSNAALLAGAEVQGNAYIFITPETNIKQARFYLDATNTTASPTQTENQAPYDFAGTNPDSSAIAFDTTTLNDGSHFIFASITLSDNSIITFQSNFSVNNSIPALQLTQEATNFIITQGAPSQSLTVTLATNDNTSTAFSYSENANWLDIQASSANTPSNIQITVDPTTPGLLPGAYSEAVVFSAAGYVATQLTVNLTVTSSGSSAYDLMVSVNPDRSAPTLLESSILANAAYIFLLPETGIKQVRFYLDATDATGSPIKTENGAPYDLAGGATGSSNAAAFDTNGLSDGAHFIFASITLADNSITTVQSNFTVNNNLPALQLDQETANFTVVQGGTSQSASVNLSTSLNTNTNFSISENASWLDVQASSGSTPSTIQITADPTTANLLPGVYTETVVFTATDFVATQLTVNLTVASAGGSYDLLVSDNTNRSAPTLLEAANISDNTFIFVSPEANIKQVRFYLDTTDTSSTPFKIENRGPYDFGGTNANGTATAFDTNTLTDGSHFILAQVIGLDNSVELLSSTFQVANSPFGFTLSPGVISESAAPGSLPVDISVLLGLNAAADGSSPSYTASSNASWLSVSPASGSAPETLTVSLLPANLAVGIYTAAVTITAAGFETAVLEVSFIVSDSGAALNTTDTLINVTSTPNNGIVSRTVSLDTSDSSGTIYSASSDSPWLNPVIGTTGVTPETVSLEIDTNQLPLGSYSGSVTFSALGYVPTSTTVNVTISAINKCAPVVCSEIKVALPYVLEFEHNNGHLLDDSNLGTGFTYVETPSNGSGYLPAKLHVNADPLNSYLAITTTAGTNTKTVNSQDNAVGVGFAGPNQITEISTTLLSPPTGTGNFEQAGLWFGFNEANYVKLIYLSTPSGNKVEFLYEIEDAFAESTAVPVNDLSASTLTLKLIADPSTKLVTALYSINGGSESIIDSFKVSPEFFSFDAAGIDPEVGTRSFTGIFATHRNGPGVLEYRFDNFMVVQGEAPPIETDFNFIIQSHPIDFPTGMVWGPNGKLYVATLFGTIRELTYDENLNVISDVTINSLTAASGSRLTLGITAYHDDPADPNAFSLWLSHSSPSVDNGTPNSGTITRLSGPGFTVAEDIITGLPRAKANHATNNLHFGPDNRLYIAVGGNTGAGAPIPESVVVTEFGEMEEQPLSAAIIVADVFSPSFDGSCANTSDIFGPPPCDVVPYATGMRNSYDFVFHSNGEMYATDNGLGVTGAFPPQAAPVCTGFASPAPWNSGGQNPGEQDDLLYRVIEGKYYGHPNPYRNECVFKDGSYQGVSPLPNYQAPMTSLGSHTSSNGIIEYTGDKACGALKNNLLITNYSLGDDVYRIILNEAGDAVVSQKTLVGGFTDPLMLSQNSQGDLFVAEFGNGMITSVQIETNGCWTELAPAPEAILDSGSTNLDGKFYMIGGKLSTGPINTVRFYDPVTNTWTQVADKPGSAVENPAAVAYNGMIYTFGGSVLPFSGAVNEAYSYNPATNTWTAIAPMPTARGGIRAEVINGKIYIAGGMNASGDSVAILEIYDPVTNTWASASNMSEPRDNAGTAVIDGKLYVVGGRERLGSGVTINGTKNTAEVYDPATGLWTPIANMPTGRRTMVVGTINGRIQVVGGEYNDADPDFIFRVNEEYDPLTNTWSTLTTPPNPRHGAAFTTIDNVLYISGGGLIGGSSFTTITEMFSL